MQDIELAQAMERSICSVLLAGGVDASAAVDASIGEGLSDSHFHNSLLGAVFAAAVSLVSEGVVLDANLIMQNVAKKRVLTKEDQDVIAASISQGGSAHSAGQYAIAIVLASQKRSLKSSMGVVLQASNDPSVDASAMQLMLQTTLDELEVKKGAANGLLDGATTLAIEAVGIISANYELAGSEAIIGVSTGIPSLDRKLEVLPADGDLVVIGARPSMGKTAKLLTVAIAHAKHALEQRNKAVKEGLPENENWPLTVIFSMEMKRDRVFTRELAALGRLNTADLRNGRIDDEDFVKLQAAVGEAEKLDIRIDDEGGLSPSKMVAKLRSLVRKTGRKVGWVGIDYLQLMSSDVSASGRFDNRPQYQIVGEISSKVKSLIAKKFDCKTYLLSQLSRKVEERANKRPVMSDLRESGAIEQDADYILLLYRDEYYNPDTSDKGMAEIIIAKTRDSGGAGSSVLCEFVKEHQLFLDIDRGRTSW